MNGHDSAIVAGRVFGWVERVGRCDLLAGLEIPFGCSHRLNRIIGTECLGVFDHLVVARSLKQHLDRVGLAALETFANNVAGRNHSVVARQDAVIHLAKLHAVTERNQRAEGEHAHQQHANRLLHHRAGNVGPDAFVLVLDRALIESELVHAVAEQVERGRQGKQSGC
ncbi:unannotated protein [freshwater metagenome]|uniref:Unannotated protein n=1 Tax=freshwater metagenome TaxID=449393 RepID=A0A6J6C157_9ZZZZ